MDRAAATGIGVSIGLHGAALAALILLVRGTAPVIESPPAIEVSFAEDVGLISAAPVPSSEPQASAATPDPGPPEDAPAPAPTPAPPLPEPRPAPPPPPRPSPQPQPRQAQPPAPQPPQSRQADRTPQRETPRPNPGTSGSGQQTRRPGLADLDARSFGSDPRGRSDAPPASVPGEARASIDAAIVRALLPCQRQPLPAPEAASIRVRMRVTLNRDGSLARAEVIRVENGNPALEMYERRMQDLAQNVLAQCSPIRGLPAQYYDVPGGWRQFPFTFDPRAR